MRRIRSILYILFLLCPVSDMFSQGAERDLYVVITFEDVHKISQHEKKEYFWIIPEDSLKGYAWQLSKLFMEGFSKTNLDDCCAGKPVNPSLITDTTDFTFNDDHYKMMESLAQILSRKREKIQSINKNWPGGQAETIIVYATPVRGRFCSSAFLSIGRTNYTGQVFIPFSSFEYAGDFWKTPKAKFVLNRDYARHPFDVFP